MVVVVVNFLTATRAK